jgi:hypothetical protein
MVVVGGVDVVGGVVVDDGRGRRGRGGGDRTRRASAAEERVHECGGMSVKMTAQVDDGAVVTILTKGNPDGGCERPDDDLDDGGDDLDDLDDDD